MNLMNPYTVGFAWAIVHSIWQISLAGIALKLLLILFRNNRPALRFNLALTSILIILITFILTFFSQVEIEKRRVESSRMTVAAVEQFQQSIDLSASSGQVAEPETASKKFTPWREWIDTWSPLISLVWALGFFIFILRFGGSSWYLIRLRKNYANPLNREWQNVALKLSKDLNIKKKFQLLESALVTVPMVIGHLKPVIILPLSLATQIPFNQLEAVLIHELAHIRRNDFLVNTLITFMESIFFYHPVFWWVLKTIDSEREHCCDDITIDLCGEIHSLSQALLDICQYNQKSHPIAAALFKNENQLLKRIKRMKTTNHTKESKLFSPMTAFVLGAALLTVIAGSSFVPGSNDRIHGLLEMPDKNSYPEEAVRISEADEPTETIQMPLFSSPPDTIQKAKKNPAPEDKTESGIIKLEMDESGQLISVTKDGKELAGEELEKYKNYSTMIAEQKHTEENVQKEQQELQELEQSLIEAKEKMQLVQNEYEEIMQEYMQLKLKASDYEDAQQLFYRQLNSQDQWAQAYERAQAEANAYGIFADKDQWISQVEEMKKQEDLFHKQYAESEQYMKDLLQKQESMEAEQRKLFEDQIKDLERISIFEKEHSKFETRIREELQNDQRWQPGEQLSFELSNKRLVINGKKQEAAMHSKYLDLYNSWFDDPLTGSEKLIIMD